MRAKILGAAAGGGFPQWNCGCRGCTLARRGEALPRTQDSIAVSADGERWVLLNASPDVLRQIEATPELRPRGLRGSPIAGVVLTSGDVDHVAGLLSLRERQPLQIAATSRVFGGLFEQNVIYRTLQRFPGHTAWQRLVIGESIELAGLHITPVAAPGRAPLHLSGSEVEDNIGVLINNRLLYMPSAAALPELPPVDVLLFDGTFFTEDELVPLGGGTAASMAHVPIRASLRQLRARRKIFVHINNTNPILLDSDERREIERAGFEVAYDGMEVCA